MSSTFGASAILSTLAPLAIILGALVATRPVGPGAALMIVEADGQRFLVSSGRQGITPIGALHGAPAPAFADALETAKLPAPDA